VREEIEAKQEEEKWVKNVVGGCCSTFLIKAARKGKLVSAWRWREQDGSRPTIRRSVTTWVEKALF
jgi:hypothetical protein